MDWLVGVLVPVGGGLVWLAYNKPGKFDLVWKACSWLLVSAFMFFTGLRTAYSQVSDLIPAGKTPELKLKLVEYDNYSIVATLIVVAIYFFLFLLSTFPSWLIDDKDSSK